MKIKVRIKRKPKNKMLLHIDSVTGQMPKKYRLQMLKILNEKRN